MSARVIKEVVSELRVHDAEFKAKMVAAEGTAKKTKASIEGVAGASDASATKFANATRQLASSVESMERTGKVAGEAAKGFLAAGSNIAFAFGPAGAAVGALSIFALAATRAFGRSAEAAREARAEFDRTLRVIERTRDYAGAGNLLNAVLYGDPSADKGTPEEEGLLRRRAEMERLRAGQRRRALPGGGYEILATREETERMVRLQEELDKLEKKYVQVQRTFETVAKAEADRVNTQERLEKERDAARRSEQDAAEAAKAGERAAERWATAFRDKLLETLGSSADRVAVEIDDLIQEGLKVGATPEQIDQLNVLKDELVASAREVDKLKALMQSLDAAAVAGVAPSAQSFEMMGDAIEEARRLLARLTPESKQYKDLLAEIERLEKARAKDLKDVADATKPGGGAAITDTTKQLALDIQQAADGALQLAQNLLGADANAISLLRSIGQVAGNLGRLHELQTAGKLTAFGAAGPVLGIIGALSSLFSDPADAERQRELARNTEALEKLTEQAGLLGIGITGAAAGRSATGLAAFLERERFGRIGVGGKLYDADDQARVAAKAFGLDIAELEQLAAEYGIELNGNIESFRQLYEAIQDTITKLGEFGTDLESQRNEAAARARVYGITDPGELLNLTRGVYRGRSPILDQALAGHNLSTSEGRAAARAALQELFEIMGAGGLSLTDAQLGDLSGDELLLAILDLIDGLNAVEDSLPGSSGFTAKPDQVITADRTQITADQASRLLGVQTSALAELRIIREALVASRTPLPIPTLGSGWSGVGGDTTIIINQNITFDGPVSPREVARVITQADIDAIDAGLGKKGMHYRLHYGRAVR